MSGSEKLAAMGDHDVASDDDLSDAELELESRFAGGDGLAGAAPADPLVLPDFGSLDPDTQQRLQALLQAAGISKSGSEGQAVLGDPEILRRLTSSVSSALDEAADALTRIKGAPAAAPLLLNSPSSCAVAAVAQHQAAVVGGREGADWDAPAPAVEEGESLLSLACSAGYFELAQVLLAMRTNVEDRGAKGDCTPLMEAASAGHADIVRLLFLHSAQVNTVSASGNTPLMYACAGGHVDVVNELLRCGADVEIRNENGHSPLMEAASAGHVDIARALIRHSPKAARSPPEFKVGLESPITLACYKGNLEMVNFLLSDEAKPDKNGTFSEEELYTALMEASMDGHLEVGRLLLEHGAPTNLASDSFESPLTLAACGGHVDLVRLLLDRGAAIEDPNDEGYTPLMEAAREGHLEVVELLVERGADLNAQTEEAMETALTLAACGGFRDVVELLVAKGAELDLGSNTALMEAAQEGHLDTVAFLIDATVSQGGDVDQAATSGDTALTYAAENGHTAVVQLLLDAGAAVDREADGGRTALMKGAKCGQTETVRLLIGRGAGVNACTSVNDQTPLSLACGNGNGEVVALLLHSGANPNHKLKDSSTCIIEAAKGGFTDVVQMLLDWPGLQIPATFPTPAVQPPASNEEKVSAFNLTVDPEFLANIQGSTEVNSTFLNLVQNSRHSSDGDTPPPPLAFPGDGPLDLSSVGEAGLGLANLNLPLADQREWLLLQAQRALMKQAGDKLAPSELTQLNEILRAQFRQMFPANGTGDLPPPLPPRGDPPPPQHGAKRKAPGSGSGTWKREGEGSVASDLRAVMEDLEALQVQAQSAPRSTLPPAPGTDAGTQTTLSLHQMAEAAEEDGVEAKRGKEATPGFDFQLPPPPPPAQAGAAPAAVTTTTTKATSTSTVPHGPAGVDLNTQTESNHDTALTLACGGGHEDLVRLLIARGADLEHRDKKGFTPLILAATAGHVPIVRMLIDAGATMEAQSERTKDTALSLACSGGRKEVVELLLGKAANKEHRNVSDYTPLSLAASGGYVDIIQLLLNQQAEINSRTGSKLGISPLMLAAMNGHTAAVKLLLDRGSDINAQIETNRNTALTLACFQGRHEVVKLLLDFRANVEHRAKTGLTPLMEAASGGYVEVGRVLLQYGADPNASPVPTSRDTALTIAADKGHHKFVELLLSNAAAVDARNKKGCTSLYLSCHGGHLETVQVLVKHKADVDAQDNRKLTPLMAAFRRGHLKVVKWLVRHVGQFPSDTDCSRFIATITSDKDLLVKCMQCSEVIATAKDRQAAEANKAAATLLQELEREEELLKTRKEAKERQKAKKKAKRQAKKAATKGDEEKEDDCDEEGSPSPPPPPAPKAVPEDDLLPEEEEEEEEEAPAPPPPKSRPKPIPALRDEDARVPCLPEEPIPPPPPRVPKPLMPSGPPPKEDRRHGRSERFANRSRTSAAAAARLSGALLSPGVTTNGTAGVVMKAGGLSPTPRKEEEAEWNKAPASGRGTRATAAKGPAVRRTEAKQTAANGGHPEDPFLVTVPSAHSANIGDWREVRRRANKLVVSSQAIARVIGRGGQNINAIREATGAHIEVEKQAAKKESAPPDRGITIRGSSDATRQAVLMINGLIQDPDSPVTDIIRKVRNKCKATAAAAAPAQGHQRQSSDGAVKAMNGSEKKRYPEVSVWVTAANGLGGGWTTATAGKKTTTTVTASDFSPFQTPNVWEKRSQDGARRNFASVAAAGLKSGGSGRPEAPQRPPSLLESLLPAPPGVPSAPSERSTSAGSNGGPMSPPAPDESKAPGYRRAMTPSSGQRATPPSSASLSPPGLSSAPAPLGLDYAPKLEDSGAFRDLRESLGVGNAFSGTLDMFTPITLPSSSAPSEGFGAPGGGRPASAFGRIDLPPAASESPHEAKRAPAFPTYAVADTDRHHQYSSGADGWPRSSGLGPDWGSGGADVLGSLSANLAQIQMSGGSAPGPRKPVEQHPGSDWLGLPNLSQPPPSTRSGSRGMYGPTPNLSQPPPSLDHRQQPPPFQPPPLDKGGLFGEMGNIFSGGFSGATNDDYFQNAAKNLISMFRQQQPPPSQPPPPPPNAYGGPPPPQASKDMYGGYSQPPPPSNGAFGGFPERFGGFSQPPPPFSVPPPFAGPPPTPGGWGEPAKPLLNGAPWDGGKGGWNPMSM